MDNKKTRIILIVVLIAALGYAAFTYWPLLSPLLGSARRPAPNKPAASALPVLPVTRPAASTEAITKNAEAVTEMDLPAAGANLVDPFALRITISAKEDAPVTTSTLPSEKKAAPVEPDLQGIWMDSEMNIAFISDQSLQVGGTVLGWRLASIAPDHVVMKKGGATKVLYLK